MGKFDHPACKLELDELCHIKYEGKWLYDNNGIQFEIKLLWLQGQITNISDNKDEIQLSNGNQYSTIITNCQNIPGGYQWLQIGQYVMVIGELLAMHSVWDTLQVKAIKITNLTHNNVYEEMWPYEVQEAKKLYVKM